MPILQWLDRDKHVKAAEAVPYRLLEVDDSHSAGDSESPNMLIQGDNLEALKALLPYYAGRVKCIYIDPPFNTGQAFLHYDDNLEHSIWLGMMYPRLQLLADLLSEDGTIAIHIDAEELAYCITILDEIFGRTNRINICTFKQGAAVGHKAINPGVVSVSNFVVIYSKRKDSWSPNRLFTEREDRDRRYNQYIANFEEDFRNWNYIPLARAFAASLSLPERGLKVALGKDYDKKLTSFIMENAKRVVRPARPDYDAVSEAARGLIDQSRQDRTQVFRLERKGFSDMYFKGGERILFYSDKLKLIDGKYVAGEPLTNVWDDLLSNNLHNEGGVEFPKGKKPEALIKRVFDLFSAPGDLVLDSFLGSGTAAAVAHKMGRRYIGIEMGEHAATHCAPRLQRVIEGDQGGISEAVGWKGGGGFRFYKLGAPVFDTEGRINEEIRFAHLAAHVWFSETHTALHKKAKHPLLGKHDGTAFYLLYNGILRDKRPDGGNVLTAKVLAALPAHDGQKVIYGEACRINAARLKDLGIIFKQTPYDLKAR
jgi:adenine-specific DNA-methyltransferase